MRLVLAIAFVAGCKGDKAASLPDAPAAKTITQELTDAKRKHAELQGKQLLDAYALWSLDNDQGCPSPAELTKYLARKSTRDPWGREWKHSCDGRYAVTSAGPDGAFGNADDVTAK
jgi:hypothetical protein